MHIIIRLFASHRDIVGAPELAIEVPDGTTIGGLWEALCERYVELRPATRSVLLAVNQEYAEPSLVLKDGDEAAFIPPVSGGEQSALFAVVEQPLDASGLQAAVQTPGDGAVVLFTGVVRDNFDGRPTAFLQYEAYREMAVPVLMQIAEQARSRWPIGRVGVHHRIGRLEIGDVAVVVAVASPHRAAAFEAAAWIMDRIKEVAPIWKREHWADGETEWRER